MQVSHTYLYILSNYRSQLLGMYVIESFVKVKKWVKELRKIVGNDIAIAIAGNKIDLEKNRHVNKQEALE